MKQTISRHDWRDPHDKNGGEVGFVLVSHDDDNIDRIVQTVDAYNPDIVAVELAGSGSKISRSDSSLRINRFLSGDLRVWTQDMSNFELALLQRLRGTAAQFSYIDISDDDPEAAGLVREDVLEGEYEKLLNFEGGQLMANLRREAAARYIVQASLNDMLRESIVAKQLEAMHDENPTARIAAVVGATHTNIQRLMRPEIQTHRMFVPDVEDASQFKAGEKIRFSPIEIAIRSLRLTPHIIDDVVEMAVDEEGYIKDKL